MIYDATLDFQLLITLHLYVRIIIIYVAIYTGMSCLTYVHILCEWRWSENIATVANIIYVRMYIHTYMYIPSIQTIKN